jgi:hypothetical protein
MFNGKYTDIAEIVERVYRDYGFDTELDVGDVMEWTWNCLNLIGVPLMYVDKVTNGLNGNPLPIVITDYRGTLPDDIYSIYLVRDYDTGIPLTCKESPYAGDLINSDYYESAYTYHTNDNYIFTSFETGDLEMAYKAFPVSPLGLPLVPDDIKVIEALTAYIAHRLARKVRIAKSDAIPRDIYEEIKQDYKWYVAGARIKMLMPDVDKMEVIKNRFLRLKQNPDLHAASFRYLPDKERLILHNGN